MFKTASLKELQILNDAGKHGIVVVSVENVSNVSNFSDFIEEFTKTLRKIKVLRDTQEVEDCYIIYTKINSVDVCFILPSSTPKEIVDALPYLTLDEYIEANKKV